jgi:hypothetical protein
LRALRVDLELQVVALVRLEREGREVVVRDVHDDERVEIVRAAGRVFTDEDAVRGDDDALP